jgi:hypothetical protein
MLQSIHHMDAKGLVFGARVSTAVHALTLYAQEHRVY